ncbi:hypothetical protein AAHA92_15728 [Salvia divinorum]|uniref:Uncharacterized protein n=1 Tax=Salvia divinorum TaxID=28513 RepID=A0ABD1HJM1_SALDI
MKSKSRFV